MYASESIIKKGYEMPCKDRVASADDYLVCRRIMQAASKNYSFASRFFPKSKLHHVEALYAFLRVGDDRVDVSHHGYASPFEAIEAWEQAYWSAFERGNSNDPVLRAFLQTSIECGIPPEIMSPYFKSMKSDLVCTRFQTFDELMDYMAGSAIPVGRGMVYILGARPGLELSKVFYHADALSVAMQLSNFWRDIAYDWSIGRVYIPQEDLQRFNVSEDDIANQRVTLEFRALLEFEIQRTESYYEIARQGIPLLASGHWAVMTGLEVYRAILTQIRRHDYNVFIKKLKPSRTRKLALVARAWLNTLLI